ncbi:hypothetical protein JZ751_021975 [Albula glossodonta]|uniref:Neutral cholesterol ester hydrolase 1 n=1 Tax=Albula glossodonta TaxID=121402 RepID=A0A8T2NR72_9TELE|nr:hypothetical protein JZ751_021975 [Albula glossodonta]
MKRVFAITCLLTVAVAYYIYIPLPSTISEPWKLMLLDATFRSAMRLGNLAHDLGLTHHIHVLNYAVNRFEMQGPESSEGVQVQDTSLGMRSYDFLCRKMAEELNAVIVSIDYRLAPDAHFPEQYNDALRASTHFLLPEVLAQFFVDPERVAMDSTLPVKFKLQALIYPVLQALDFNTPSYQQNGNVPILYRPLMAKFWLEYLDGDPSFVQAMLANNHTALDLSQAAPSRAKLNWTELLPPSVQREYKPVVQAQGSGRIIQEVPALLDVRAAPLLAERDVLSRVPPAYILTCEHDVLRDDGLMYGRRLEEAGVAVTNDHYEDGFHGCMIFAFWPTYFSVGRRTVKNYIHWLDQNL